MVNKKKTDKPTGKPTEKPTNSPTTRPTNRPTQRTKTKTINCFATIIAPGGGIAFDLQAGSSGSAFYNLKIGGTGPNAIGINCGVANSANINFVDIQNNEFVNLIYGVYDVCPGSYWTISDNVISVTPITPDTVPTQTAGVAHCAIVVAYQAGSWNQVPLATALRNAQTIINNNVITVNGPGFGVYIGYGVDTNTTVSNNQITCIGCKPSAAISNPSDTTSSGIKVNGALNSFITNNVVSAFPVNIFVWSDVSGEPNTVYVNNNNLQWAYFSGCAVSGTAGVSDYVDFVGNWVSRNTYGYWSTANSGSLYNRLLNNNFQYNTLFDIDLSLTSSVISWLAGNKYDTCQGCP